MRAKSDVENDGKGITACEAGNIADKVGRRSDAEGASSSEAPNDGLAGVFGGVYGGNFNVTVNYHYHNK